MKINKPLRLLIPIASGAATAGLIVGNKQSIWMAVLAFVVVYVIFECLVNWLDSRMRNNTKDKN